MAPASRQSSAVFGSRGATTVKALSPIRRVGAFGFDVARRARLRALVTAQLSNGAEVWNAHRSGATLPPLRFRNGLVLLHGDGDAPLFLLFEVFANGCYRRNSPAGEPGEPIVDIGANIGAFTLECAVRFPSVRIEAYEPNPRAFRMLSANITANRLEDRVSAYQEAVGPAVGVLRLWAGGNSITATAYPHSAEAGDQPTECPMVDLRTVLARAGGAISLVKMDAEGAEADIIEGGREVLRSIARFVGEYHADRVPDVVARCRTAFERSGFTFNHGCSRRCGPMFSARRID
jgi:FkbM family methyltransferase